MTENEAIKDIKRQLLEIDSEDADITLSTESLNMAIQALEDMQKIKALGDCYIIPKNGVWKVNGVDIHKAIEKQIPKKPDYQGEHEKCPSCGSFHVFGKHCTECGQAVDYD